MSIRISSFLGKFGFEARRIAPNLASSAYLKLQFMTRGTIQDQYIKWFMEQDETPMPQVVNIETINRCNSTCSFCTAYQHEGVSITLCTPSFLVVAGRKAT